MKRLSDDPAVRLAECRGEPVPPTGGDVETLGWLFVTPLTSTITNRWDLAKRIPYPVIELVDRAHVTRLTAENARLQAEVKQYQKILRTLVEEATCADWSCEDTDSVFHTAQMWCGKFNHMKSRLTQATTIIDRVARHVVIDVVTQTDIDAFRKGETPEESAARAEVDRVMGEPAGDGSYPLTTLNEQIRSTPSIIAQQSAPAAKCLPLEHKFMGGKCSNCGHVMYAPAAKDGE